MILFIEFFAWIAQLIFGFVSKIIILIIDLANYPFFSIDTIKEFTNKVFMVIGILMLFKLVVSAIQYIVNPDMFDDKNKGLASILKRTVIAVIFLAFVRPAFELAIDIQKDLVAQIPQIIFSENGKTIQEMGEVGDTISTSVINGFLEKKEGKNPKLTQVKDTNKIYDVLTDGCDLNVISGFDASKCSYNALRWIITIPIGVALVYILISMAIDVSIRTIKLGIVQIFAPIPIVSYVTDEKKTQTWLKTSLQIYADLFIRLGVVYFVIYFIDIIMKGMNSVKYEGTTDFIYIQVFVIIGLLLFAKKAPKFICDLLGFDAAGESIGDMFKRAGGMFGATMGTGRALLASGLNSRSEIRKKAGVGTEEWKNLGKREQRDRIKKAAKEYGRGRRVAQVFGSTGAALRNGMFESIAHTKGYKDVMASSRTAAERSYDMNKAMHDNGVSRFAYQKELINRRLGIVSDLDVMNAEIEAAKNASDKSKAALDWAHNNRGAKLSNLKFDDEFIKNIGNKQFVVGMDSNGKEIKVSLADMSVSGRYSINTVENQLKATIEDRDGRLKNMGLAGQEIISKAQAALDELQGLGDSFAVNASRRDDAYKTKVGFKDNPAFNRAIQEAYEADIMHSGDTQFGRQVQAKALEKGIAIMDNGKFRILDEYLGDWLALNKKMGQEAQTENIAAKGTQGAAATVKSIADKYDKKK